MVRPDLAKWEQTLADLRRLSVAAEHPRTRERFLALYEIGAGHTNATQWAAAMKHDDNTVLKWVHTYNSLGPEAVTYQRSGGRPPLLRPNKSSKSLPRGKRVRPLSMACLVTTGR